jgi:uncharacterized protein (TIGR04222 family)
MVVVALLLLASAARAQQGNTLALVLSVEDDGSAAAVERLELSSPMREPLRWRMPTAFTSPLGVRRLLFVEMLEISDGRGNKLETKTREYGNALDVLIPVQPLADNTIRITYQVLNAVRFREAHDELLWQVGRAWSAPFRQASVNISVPDSAAGQVKAQLLHRGTHSPATEVLTMQGAQATFEVSDPWPSPNGPLLDLVFAPGVLQKPPFRRRALLFLRANPIVLFPGVLVLVMAGFRKYSTRGDGTDITVTPRYEPPEDLPPAEAGYLIDGSLNPRDLAAMLLDLARRGFIRIEPGSPDEGIPYPGPDFVLRLLKPMDDWKGACPYEHTMLFHTFYGGQWTKLSSVSLRFYTVVPMIERVLQDELRQKQLYIDPRRIGAQRILAVVLLGAAMWAAQAAGWFALAQSWLLAAVVVLSFVMIVLFFSRGVNHRTAKGARVFAELRGFQEFMNTVEADRMQRITPDVFERYLPYAVALGVEHHWGAAFSTISTGPPLWWDSAKSGGIPDFVHLLGSYSHAPRRGPKPMTAAAESGTS